MVGEGEKLTGHTPETLVQSAARTSVRTAKNARLVLFIVILVIVCMIGMTMLIQRNNRNIDRLQDSTEEVQTSVLHLEEFVEGLENTSPEEQERDAAIGEAVRQVPQIRSILCEAFPEASACQTVGG